MSTPQTGVPNLAIAGTFWAEPSEETRLQPTLTAAPSVNPPPPPPPESAITTFSGNLIYTFSNQLLTTFP